jgi:cyanophycinase-like exopeptidase
MSRIVIMGSGETAPTMVRTHREVLAANPPGPAVLIDTPFAFQTNRDELVARTRLYFAQSVGRELDPVRWPPPEDDPASRERALALLDSATWAFTGPGSPTYALGQWRGTGVPGALVDLVRRGGTLVMGSAAALTLGTHTVPVYEIYKVGAAPVWAEGLDLLGRLCGMPVAVVPHYDNREGGTHDTRYCYLGEDRLADLESALPDEVGVLGVDEHTAVVLDLNEGTARVSGNGTLSVRRRGTTRTFPSGQAIALRDLAAMLRGDTAVALPSQGRTTAPGRSDRQDGSGAADRPDDEPVASSLREEADRARARFEAARSERDTDGCVAAVLALEAAVAAWRADTLQSDDVDEARRVLRALVVRLGELAAGGAQDPRESIAPYVDLLMDLRAKARDDDDFATSDLVRDRLVALRVEVHDTPGGSSWDLT